MVCVCGVGVSVRWLEMPDLTRMRMMMMFKMKMMFVTVPSHSVKTYEDRIVPGISEQ